MDYANGQYAYHIPNGHGNAILHGSFDQERHGTGNGSAPNPLQNTPNGTLPPISAADEAYLMHDGFDLCAVEPPESTL